MPTIAKIDGVVIVMHLTRKEHLPPHVHALYGEYEATFEIENAKLQYGVIPKKAIQAVERFIKMYQYELMEMWNSEQYQYIEYEEVYYD